RFAVFQRLGLGPVFICESILSARHWQVYAGRSLFVLGLLLGMTVVWISKVEGPLASGAQSTAYGKIAEIGAGVFFDLTGSQLALVMLAAPAATAGSINVDRARGTLLHMMVTDLSDTEIVLGKLAARLAPVVGLIVCAVPVMALAALLGGIDFGALAG